MKVQCKNCKSVFMVTGLNSTLVLSGGADCPKCGKKYGVNIIIAERKT